MKKPGLLLSLVPVLFLIALLMIGVFVLIYAVLVVTGESDDWEEEMDDGDK